MATRIRPAAALLAGLLWLTPAFAQDTGEDHDPDQEDGARPFWENLEDGVFQPDLSEPPTITTEGNEAVSARSARLRGLDKVTGRVRDIDIDVGDAIRFGRLEVRLGECRHPVDDPASDAYAQMIITDLVQNRKVFSGWMIASSPALSALDDARYDIWVISCNS